MSDSALRLTIENGLAHLVFTQGQRGNPIDGAFCRELNEASIILSERKDIRAVFVTAEGNAFSYGGDIASFITKLDDLPSMIKRWTADLHMAIARLQRMDAPLVAAVHGICAGGMAGFIAGCDIVVAAENSKFVAAYAGIGYCCDAGSSITLSRRMGLGRARKFLLLNETLNAQASLDAGLVDELAAADAYLNRARDIAEQLAAGPTKAYGEIRRLLLSAGSQPLETQLENEAQGLARCAGSDDAREGLSAFAAKRKPSYTGQ
ncbi:enoyl-CoA hydratase/isomerase family protein [Pseudomonas fluorescens]|uniref:4-chlorobenzoyl coenzyme A dehalogenase-1 n=1 Tax=Pseudomonas fluorescens TaxID=294 RepID=A0A5E7UW61_PSEFL|nr:enoyl-CoA hydratase/isomerase family protein [Pseudomonas fluorescens]VVQ15283.1 4-chlorobenzoyl coenzyme A dehalogenase-1 [Pseudomonas fluorescens]